MVTNIDSDQNFPWWSYNGNYGPFVDHSYPGVDDEAPRLLSAIAISSTQVVAIFNRPMLIAELNIEANFTITPDLGSTGRTVTLATPNASGIFVVLTLSGDLTEGASNYNLEVNNITAQVGGQAPISPYDNADFSGPAICEEGDCDCGPGATVDMPFLEINEITIPVKANSVRETTNLIGFDARSHRGSEISEIRNQLKSWKVETPPLEWTVAEALEALLLGSGDNWSFEDAGSGNAWQYSSKGRPHSGSISGASRTTSTSQFGTASLQLTNGSEVRWQLENMTRWTALFWRRVAAGAWQHLATTSSGLYYLSGAVTGSAHLSVVTVVGGLLTLLNNQGVTSFYDDLVIIPAILPATWIASAAARTTRWPTLPQFELGGTLVNDDVLPAIGRDVQSDLVIVNDGAGAYQNNRKTMEFSIKQQPAAL